MTPQRSIDSAQALCQKLERTFYRRSSYGEHQVDWVFDFAVTAWHLVDWVAIERNAGGKAGVQTTQTQLKSQCPELAVCEKVCNGAKHFVLGNPQLKSFSVAAAVRSTDDLAGISKMNVVGDENVDIVLTPAVSITDRDGNSWQAVDLFRRVLSFWQAELGLPKS